MSNETFVATATSSRPAPKWQTNPIIGGPLPLNASSSKDRWHGNLFRPASAAITNIGPASQVIRCWLPSRGVSFVLAERGSGKTLLLLDQALCLATDRSWMGFPTQAERYVVYLIGEDQQGTMANVEAWYKEHGLELSDCSVRIVFIPLVPNLLDENDCLSLVRHVRTCLPANSKPVIFIDTWQRATSAASLNDDVQMQLAITNAELIGRELGGPVIAASHPPKGKKSTIAGSSVIENSSVAIWQFEGDRRNIAVSVTRIKGIGHGTRLRLKLKEIELDGEDNFGFARSGAILGNEGTGNPTISTKPLAKAVTEREVALLMAMKDGSGRSFQKLADRVTWNDSEKPTASQVRNVMDKLSRRDFVKLGEGGRYFITTEGTAFLAIPTV